MTKEELIELSDLNRKDNIKYISSEAQGIAITLDSDRYAPTICKLERAYICGRRKSEEQITKLEKENAELKEANIELQKVIQQREQRGLEVQEDLLKEKEDLKDANEKVVHLACNQNKDLKYKLIKAKELLKWWVNHCGYYDLYYAKKTEQFLKEFEIQEDRLCEYCDKYKSCPDGKRCRTCDNGSKWKRRKEK